MAEDKDQDLRDIRAEEATRGKKQPKKVLSLARRRVISEMAKMLQDPRCDQKTHLEVIREYGLQEGSDEFRQLLA
jgi:tRNA nucleotidyltransferase/poly(A) polymerase